MMTEPTSPSASPEGGLRIELRGRIALVTGGSRGIGEACAVALARAGADVAVHYASRRDAAEAVADTCRSHGVRAITVQGDHRRRNDEQALVAEVEASLGPVDIAVLNAGIWKRAPIDEMTPEELDEMLDINLRAPMRLCRALAPGMIERGRGGSILLIASTAAQRGEAHHSHYAATKGALVSLTKSLASELAPARIRVNCVAPGWVHSDMTRDILASGQGEAIRKVIPLGDAGRPEDIGHPVAFLASPLAAFITGEILNVNGGAVLCG